MSSILNITKELLVDHWLITAQLASGASLPPDIFLYLNTGTNVLGEYFGTCSVNDITRLTTYTGVTVNIFGNKYLKYSQAKIKVALEDDTLAVITALVKNVTNLSIAYKAKVTTTQSYTIP